MNSRSTASSNGTIKQSRSCSAPCDKVSGGTDRYVLGLAQFEDHSVQQRVGQTCGHADWRVGWNWRRIRCQFHHMNIHVSTRDLAGVVQTIPN
jgi:hypothetical protein